MTADPEDDAAGGAPAGPLRPGFDHGTDPDLLADIAGTWDRLREASRTFSSDAYPWTLWYLTRFDDVDDAFRDHERLSSRQTNYNTEDSHRWIPAQVDPPDHTAFRAALNPHFSPGRVAGLEPAMRAVCAGLIDGFAGDGRCELVTQFAQRFPTAVFLQLVGLPAGDTDTFLAWAQQLLHSPGAGPAAAAARKAATRTIYGYLRELIAARRARPGDDVISRLVSADIDGRPVTDDELLEMAFLLYVAGMDTVAGTLSYVVAHLAVHPADRRLLAEDPGRIPVAVEEFLRYYSIASPARVVQRDHELAGCPVRAGDRVVLATWPANRDPRRFDQAGDFVIDRTPNRHCAFGAGIHRCVGAHLARLELRVALEEWLRVIPDFEIEPGARLTQHVAGAAGLDTLPLRWPPHG